MRRTIVASRNILGIALIVFSEAYTDGLAFDLIRGKSADQFVNLFCTNDTCASNSCERHKATCGSEVCKYCVCNKDNHTSTYFPNNDSVYGECMQDLVIARNSGRFDLIYTLYFHELLFTTLGIALLRCALDIFVSPPYIHT